MVERRNHTSMVGGSIPPLITKVLSGCLGSTTHMDVYNCEKSLEENPQRQVNLHCGKPQKFILRRELKHLSTFRKRNQPRFRKYWRKKAEETNQQVKQSEQGGILDQRW